MGRLGMLAGFWWGSQRETNRYKDIDVGGRIILKLISELIESGAMDLIQLQDKDQLGGGAILNTVMNLRIK
jgi:hypothetical protein